MYQMWWRTGANLALLAFEAQGVIAQRMMMLSLGGPKVQAEFNRMVTEKMAAAALAGMQLASGAGHDAVINSYRRKVRANSRRLSR